jgi:hypothetical protein
MTKRFQLCRGTVPLCGTEVSATSLRFKDDWDRRPKRVRKEKLKASAIAVITRMIEDAVAGI